MITNERMQELLRMAVPRKGCPDLDSDWPGLFGKPRGPTLCVLYPGCSCGEIDAKRQASAAPDLAAALQQTLAQVKKLDLAAHEQWMAEDHLVDQIKQLRSQVETLTRERQQPAAWREWQDKFNDYLYREKREHLPHPDAGEPLFVAAPNAEALMRKAIARDAERRLPGISTEEHAEEHQLDLARRDTLEDWT